MQSMKRLVMIGWVLILLGTVLYGSGESRGSESLKKISLTPGEKRFLREHPKIVLGTDKYWHPYVEVDSNGRISGYDRDVLDLINRVSGSHFLLRAGNWKQMQEEAKARRIDGLSTGAAIASRRSYLNFSDIYITVNKMLVVSSDNPKNIHTLDDLKGKTIALHNGNLADEKTLKYFPDTLVKRYDTVEKMLQAVASGDADAMFANGSTLFLANELGMPYFKKVALLPDRLELVFAIRNDWPEAISIINKSLKMIGEEKLEMLQKKWFWQDKAMPLLPEQIKLSEEQRSYLRQKGVIRYCIDPDWMPLEAIIEGKPTGMSVDFLRLFSKRIGITFKLLPVDSWEESLTDLESGRCDIIPMMMPTRSRSTTYHFTTPYLSFPIVLATTFEKPYIPNLHAMKGKTLAIVRGYVYGELLEKRYPEVHFVKVNSSREGLEAVRDGLYFGFVGNLYTVGYQIQKHFISELKITGKFDKSLQLAVAISRKEPKLFHIMQQVIDSLVPESVDGIVSRWISVSYVKEPDYTYVWWAFAVMLAAAALLLYRHAVVERYNRQLKIEVANKVEELRKKDKILIEKLRMAAMGEMLSMIAHQWRQPLSAVSSTILGIDLRINLGKYDMEKESDRKAFFAYLSEKHRKINGYVSYLSGTVDDFRNFFRPNRKREQVALTQPIDRALGIIGETLRNRGIQVRLQYECDEEIALFQNEVMQVLLNLLKNCKHNFEERGTADPLIEIATRALDDRLIISVCDNGGGIPEAILPRIFDPYFSTKNEEHGTGLGLYMSKTMIEEHHNGRIEAENTGQGVCFIITFFRDAPGRSQLVSQG